MLFVLVIETGGTLLGLETSITGITSLEVAANGESEGEVVGEMVELDNEPISESELVRELEPEDILGKFISFPQLRDNSDLGGVDGGVTVLGEVK
jgi:hypothetical protein